MKRTTVERGDSGCEEHIHTNPDESRRSMRRNARMSRSMPALILMDSRERERDRQTPISRVLWTFACIPLIAVCSVNPALFYCSSMCSQHAVPKHSLALCPPAGHTGVSQIAAGL